MSDGQIDGGQAFVFCVNDLGARVCYSVSGTVTAVVQGTEEEAEHRGVERCSGGGSAAAPVSTRILGRVLASKSYSWKQWSGSRHEGPQPIAG